MKTKQRVVKVDRRPLLAIRMDARRGLADVAGLQVETAGVVIQALVPLEFNERRAVLRWACDFFQLDPTKLGAP